LGRLNPISGRFTGSGRSECLLDSDPIRQSFKLIDEGRYAIRVPVKLGRSSVSTIEIIDGLKEGIR